MTDDDTDLEALYGERAKFSEYQAGQRVRYRADGMIRIGEITWVSGPGTTARGKPHPTEYWIDGLTCVYQTDILGLVDSDEPALEHCPYCGPMHQTGTVDQCALRRRKQDMQP